MISGHVGAEQPTAEFGTFLSLPSDERGFWQPEVSGGGYLLGSHQHKCHIFKGKRQPQPVKSVIWSSGKARTWENRLMYVKKMLFTVASQAGEWNKERALVKGPGKTGTVLGLGGGSRNLAHL